MPSMRSLLEKTDHRTDIACAENRTLMKHRHFRQAMVSEGNILMMQKEWISQNRKSFF